MAAARRTNGGRDREESLEERLDRASLAQRPRESGHDLLDVPAAVVCARCGDADCAGCENDLSRSGIVSIVAWERPAMPLLSRLWSTARSTTRDAEGFFELLPDGPLLPALRFAAACELVATTAAFAGLVAIVAVIAPQWLKQIAIDPSSRSVAIRIVVLGLPAFAGLLVVAHAAHGLSIDLGALRSGGRSARSRALRFGLYACGWDLVMGPLGAVVVALKEGLGPALRLGSELSGLPTRATNAFLRGCYRLEGAPAQHALRTSYAGATLATLLFAAVVVAAVMALIVR